MDNSLKGLILAAGTIITCIVIGLGFFISREARDTAASGAGQISKLNAEFNESDKIMYDGLEVSGSEVINVINKCKNDNISIRVKTKSDNTSYYIYRLNDSDPNDYKLSGASSTQVKTAQKPGATNYINPNAQFTGAILRDKNEVIVAITFDQK